MRSEQPVGAPSSAGDVAKGVDPIVENAFDAMRNLLCSIKDMVAFGAMSGFPISAIFNYAKAHAEGQADISEWLSAIGESYEEHDPEGVVVGVESAVREMGWHPASTLAFMGSSYWRDGHSDRLGIDAKALHYLLPHGGGIDIRRERFGSEEGNVVNFPNGMVVPGDMKVDSTDGLRSIGLDGVRIMRNIAIHSARGLERLAGAISVHGEVAISSCADLRGPLVITDAKMVSLSELPSLTEVPEVSGRTALTWSGKVGFWDVQTPTDPFAVGKSLDSKEAVDGLVAIASSCGREEAFGMAMGAAIALYGDLDEDRNKEEERCAGLISILAALDGNQPWAVESAMAMTHSDRHSISLSGKPASEARSRRLIVAIGLQHATSKQ
jgi:hypothetical protein